MNRVALGAVSRVSLAAAVCLTFFGLLSLSASDDRHAKKSKAPAEPNFSIDATVVKLDAGQLVAHTDDGRTLTVTVDQKTQWQRDGATISAGEVKPGAFLHMDAFENDESFLTAALVNVSTAPRLQRRAPVTPGAAPGKEISSGSDAAKEDDTPPDDPDRPILRRGKPAPRPSSTDTSDQAADAKTKSPARSTSADKSPGARSGARSGAKTSDGSIDFTIDADDTSQKQLSTGTPTLVSTAMDWVGSYTHSLPNYLCQQVTTRYGREAENEDWRPIDVVTAKIAYENGREHYSDITVGGKRVNKDIMALGGSTSTGEFAAILDDLFAPQTAAAFSFSRSTTLGNSAVSVYRFAVDLDHSHWTINIGSQSLHPVYSGMVWIEKSKGEVRKIEMQADQLPSNFPARSIYQSVGYDLVRLGTSSYLLPVDAVNQACFRHQASCTKNDLEWRDYQRFTGESTVTFH